MIIALQRPDAQSLPNGIRDNLLAKVSLGRLSELGYKMTYGVRPYGPVMIVC